MANLISLVKTVFLFPNCMWGWRRGVGWLNINSDHFLAITAYLEKLWFFHFWPLFLVPNRGCRRGWLPTKRYLWQKKFSISANWEQSWVFLYKFFLPWFGGGAGVNKSKNNFRPIFSPFQPIWSNFDFVHFWQNFFPGGGEGGLNKSGNYFRPIFLPFQPIWGSFNFVRGGTPKFIFTIFHLVRPIWMCKQKFRPLQPFLLVNLVE